jgi:hypothetical protein
VFKFREALIEAGVAAAVAALLFPFLTLIVKRKRRHAKFAEQFPDAMDIIVRSLRAGPSGAGGGRAGGAGTGRSDRHRVRHRGRRDHLRRRRRNRDAQSLFRVGQEDLRCS